MTVRRVMPVHTVPDLEAARAYGAVLGLREVMNLGWIVTLADDELRHQISVMTRDKTAPVNPNVSIEVDDVDAHMKQPLTPGCGSCIRSATRSGVYGDSFSPTPQAMWSTC